MNNGDGKRFHKFGTLINKIKNLGPKLKYRINSRPFNVIPNFYLVIYLFLYL